jgi:hypothetical protein
MHRAPVATSLLLSILLAACGSSRAGSAPPARNAGPRRATQVGAQGLRFRDIGRLPAPIQLPSATALPDGRTLVLAGLSQADTSTDGIALIDPSGASRSVGRLPAPRHDAAAATIAGRAYLIGGGNLTATPSILRIGEDGRTAGAGRLPVGASDVAAASIGSRAYVVGGYTGSTPLRSILAFAPGRPVQEVATLPAPLRYAAVAAVGGRVLVAGGTSGTAAQRAIFRFDPATRRVARIGQLPRGLTHAAGASLGGRFYVIGGRGDAVDSASAAVWSVDPSNGRVRRAGRLPVALSDVAAASGSGGVLVIGGRDHRGRVHDGILRANAGG